MYVTENIAHVQSKITKNRIKPLKKSTKAPVRHIVASGNKSRYHLSEYTTKGIVANRNKTIPIATYFVGIIELVVSFEDFFISIHSAAVTRMGTVKLSLQKLESIERSIKYTIQYNTNTIHET